MITFKRYLSFFSLFCFFMVQSVHADQPTDDKAGAPIVGKAFIPSTINAGGTSMLNITLSNPNPTSANIIGSFTDSLDNLTISGTVNPNQCGGTVSTTSSSFGSTVTLTGGAIPANGSCVISVPVTAAFSGNFTDTLEIGALQTSLGQNLEAACATLNVISTLVPPFLGKSFNPVTVAPGSTSQLTITLSNPNTVDANILFPLIDFLPSGLVASNAMTNCPGGNASTDGFSVTLTGGSIPAGGSCNITVTVFAAASGTFANELAGANLFTSVGRANGGASATLSVTLPGAGPSAPPVVPTVGKAFLNPLLTPISTINAGGTATLSITLTNPNNAAVNIIGKFTDTLPAGLTTVAGTALQTNCGTGVASQTTNSVTLTGGSIAAGATCTLSVRVTAPLSGQFTNAILPGALNTSAGPNPSFIFSSLTAVSSVVVPSVGKSFSPATISQGGISTLTITLSNPNPTAATITADFVDTLPSGPIYGTPTVTGSGCGTVSLSGTTLTLAQGGSIPANGTCIITVPLSVPFGGNFTNNIPSGALVTSNGTNSSFFASVCATLSVVPAVPFPSISKDFCPREICLHESSILTITLFNPSPLPAAQTAPLVDVIPEGLRPSRHVSNTCGGTAMVLHSTLTLSGATIPAFGFCTVSLEVTAEECGFFTNFLAPGALKTDQGNNFFSASATLEVFDALESTPN